MDGKSLFFEPDRHGEALALRAAICLESGEYAAAFPYADRLCRLNNPRARDLLLRSQCSRGAGHAAGAAHDLSRALEIDPTDRLVLRHVLEWGETEQKRETARGVVGDPLSDRDVLLRALALLFDAGARLQFHLQRRDGDLAGWAVWPTGASLALRLDVGATRLLPVKADPSCRLAGKAWSCAEIVLAGDSDLRRIDFLLDGVEAGSFAAPRPPEPPSRFGDAQKPCSPQLSVIIPVYEDFEATKACFAALFAEGGKIETRVVVIDDASPNPNLRAWLDVQAATRKFTLIRNDRNLGFAASVNKALALCPHGDVVLLNADAAPSPLFLERLARVALLTQDAGTVTPLSNNGEFTSFPEPFVANPLGSPQEVARLAALAWRANGAATVELPNGVGFCLYITRACLDAVGPLPEIYSRGYYEDVEFCLRAREKGFRNLCATGVYVGHVGSRSFRTDKRRLVMRNLATLEQRFPDCTSESLAFQRADPLARHRGAIEALDPVRGEAVLLVCGEGSSGALAREEAQLRFRMPPEDDPQDDDRKKDSAQKNGPAALICQCDIAGKVVRLRNASGGAPQSLAFSLADARGLAALRDWLGAIDLRAIEIFDPLSVPIRLLMLLFGLGRPVDLAGGDCEWVLPARLPKNGANCDPAIAGPCEACASPFARDGLEAARALRLKRRRALLSKVRSIRPLDRMSEVFARHVFGDALVARDDAHVLAKTPFAPRDSANGALAILSPSPCVQADRMIVALGRALLRRGQAAGIVVLGECVDDLAVMGAGNVFVAGRVETEEYERLFAQYEISALMSPHRTRFFGHLDRASIDSGLPKAYFDWTYGKLETSPGDLALDPRLCDARAAAALADWLGSVRAGTGEQ